MEYYVELGNNSQACDFAILISVSVSSNFSMSAHFSAGNQNLTLDSTTSLLVACFCYRL
jgi:hypothetical protein